MKKKAKSQLDTARKLRLLSSLNQVEYDDLLSVFSPLVEKKLRHYTLKGDKRLLPSHKEDKRSSLYGSCAKLDFLLLYLKAAPLQFYHAFAFQLSQAKVSEWLSFLLPVLVSSLETLSVLPQVGDSVDCSQTEANCLLVDVTERQVGRACDKTVQQEEYSGKKKCHSVKNLLISEPSGRVIFLSETYEGRVHDKAIWDDLIINNKRTKFILDAAFQGIEKLFPNAITPFKKKKNMTLSATQKQLNRAIAQIRITIEHTFAAIKRLRIVKDKIRMKSYKKRQELMLIATALHNLRIKHRTKPILNRS